MPEMWLSDDPARVQQAVELLQAALVAPAGKRRKVVITETNGSDEPGAPQEAGYVWIDQVLIDGEHIVIVPLSGHLEIYLSTVPIEHSNGESYRTYVDHNGDFVNIAMPYVPHWDKSIVLGQKWSIHILRDEDVY